MKFFNAMEVFLHDSHSCHHLLLRFELKTKEDLVNGFSFPAEAGCCVTLMAMRKMLSNGSSF